MTRFDSVVVGAGAAGSVIAGRISEDLDRSVLLLEAGQTPGLSSGFPEALLDGAQVPNSWSVCKVLTIDLALR